MKKAENDLCSTVPFSLAITWKMTVRGSNPAALGLPPSLPVPPAQSSFAFDMFKRGRERDEGSPSKKGQGE